LTSILRYFYICNIQRGCLTSALS